MDFGKFKLNLDKDGVDEVDVETGESDVEVGEAGSPGGVGEPSGVVGGVGSSSVVEVVSSDGGESVGGVDLGSVDGVDGVVNPFLVDEGEDFVVAVKPMSRVGWVDPVVRHAEVFEKLEPGEKERRRVKRRLKSSESGSYPRGGGSLESGFRDGGAKEYLVDGEGVLVKPGRSRSGDGERFEKLVRAAESGVDVVVPEGFDGEVLGVDESVVVVYPWSRVGEGVRGRVKKERVNKRELEFYKNLGVSKGGRLDGDLAERVRGRVGGGVGSQAARRASKALVRSGVGGSGGVVRGGSVGVTLKDFEVLCFLAKFKYASAVQVSNLHGVRESTGVRRLQGLQGKGLVESARLWGSSNVWFLTSAGMLLSGFDLPLLDKKNISFALIGHQFVVNNVASNLIGGGVNVLQFDEFPLKNRVNANGVEVFGEEVVSEVEIQSSFLRMKQMQKSEVYRPIITSSIDNAFIDWERGGRVGGSPESVHGNEYMWMLFPPFSLNTVYHSPDIVLKRPRGPNGESRNIAIEVELNPKASDRYERILRSYRADTRIYEKVYWVCKSAAPAKALERIAKEINLWQEGRIEILPIITRDGVFRGRELWKI